MIYGRRPRQLVIVWVVSLGAILLIHWFEVNAPAFHFLLLPFYWIIFGIALFMTWRWLRGRSRKDRRSGDRRRADRRERGDTGPTSS
jgi:hypothetical protein